MKLKGLFFKFLFLLLASVYSSIGQNIQVEFVTLLVDTTNPTVVGDSYFVGQNPGENPSDFLTVVDIGAVIQWNALPIAGNDEIHIISIRRKPGDGPNVFDMPLKRNVGSERSVKAIIRNSTRQGPDPQDYRYEITYTIGEPANPGPNPTNGITIDPLIRTNQ